MLEEQASKVWSILGWLEGAVQNIFSVVRREITEGGEEGWLQKQRVVTLRILCNIGN